MKVYGESVFADLLIIGGSFFCSETFEAGLGDIPVNFVNVTGSGEDAVSFIEVHNVDVVLVDLDHTGLDSGVTTAGRISAMFALPVVFACEKGSGATIPAEALCMPGGFLEKPFTGKEMHTVLEAARHVAGLERRAVRAENKARANERKYNLIADNIQDVLVTLDPGLKCTYASPSLVQFLGFEPTEFVGRPISGVMSKDSFKKLENWVSGREWPADEPGRFDVLVAELEMLKKDGSRAWSELRLSPVIDGEFRNTGYIAVFKDIDRTKKIIEQLQESEEKFRTLAESCPYGILIFQDEYWTYTNPAGEMVSGYCAEEIYKMKFWEVVHPDHREMVRERGLKRQSGEKTVPSYDFKIVDKAGKTKWVSLTGTSCMFRGRPAGMITIFDITQRKQRQQVYWESEEKYRTIIENIEEGYYEVDLKGNFTFFNEPVCRIAQLEPHELWGMSYRKFISENAAGELFRIFKKLYKTRVPVRAFDLEVMRPDGQKRHIEMSASLITDHSGEATGFRGIMRDITQRKQAEEEKAMLEAQLLHAHKMEAVGTLAGGIAHDFNNILQAINGYTQLLLMNKGYDDPDHEKLVQLEKASERATGLIQQLLTFSRKVEGRYQLISLNNEINTALKFLSQTLPKMIEIRTELDHDLWPVSADPLHIEQILLNLASNAADAMPGGGLLTIETKNIVLGEAYCKEHVETVPGKYVMLTVADSGCGMDPETVRHIFDPFYTTKEIGKGTGLGLASVYGIVKGHGGRIDCYSEVGCGAVFRIYLPAAARPGDLEDKPEKTVAAVAGGDESILIIDDESAVREMAKEMLEYFGYRVFCAESGEVALDMYSRGPERIDLVLLDLNMPGMGGYKCMQALLNVNPRIKVIIASGYSTDQHAGQAVSHGAAAFIGKPYHLNEMARKVRSVLDWDLN